MAEQYNGNCFLRFDDTNPEAEKVEFIDHIQEIIAWMGWKPWKVILCSWAVQGSSYHTLYIHRFLLVKGIRILSRSPSEKEQTLSLSVEIIFKI